jgi:hypothetical protein
MFCFTGPGFAEKSFIENAVCHGQRGQSYSALGLNSKLGRIANDLDCFTAQMRPLLELKTWLKFVTVSNILSLMKRKRSY